VVPLRGVSVQSYCYTVPKKKAKLPLSKTHPKLAKEAFGWDPENITFGSNTKKVWMCSKGHIWSAPVIRRTKGGGCLACLNKKVINGENDLKTIFPEIAQEADGWNPENIVSGSAKRMRWVCSSGHKWNATVSNRTNKGTRCPVCFGEKVLIGFNDLQTTHPEVAKQANGWDPTKFKAGSSKMMTWQCPLAHQWRALIVSRTRTRPADCPYCTNRKLLVGFNDLKTTHPEIAIEAYGWDPSTVTRGMDKRKKWRCKLNHVWETDVIVRTRGSGCPSCSPTGYNAYEEGFLYFLSHPVWNMFQIGITNNPKTRLNFHFPLGWELIEIRGPMEGHLTQQWETAILRMLKAKGADLSNSKIAGKFDGYSEAWSKSTFTIKSIKELMRLTEKFEEEKK
jgi:hypothetical protein